MTIVSTDVDLAEMECGENQWLTDIRRQSEQLTCLTNDVPVGGRLFSGLKNLILLTSIMVCFLFL